MNKEIIMAGASIFSPSCLSDGATIARMPLINIFAMCSNIPPTCAAIHDCSDHIEEGDNKYVSFLPELSVETVLKYDPTYCTLMFSFLIVQVM